MIRVFSTHNIRECKELTGRIWNLRLLNGTDDGKNYSVFTPCCWESIPDLAAYRGKGEFSTSFYAGGNIRLEFKGVSHTATVYVDDCEVVTHYNAYTGFDVILKGLDEGIHTLTVVADNSFSEQSALHIPNDYKSYGGVTRPVVLEKLNDLYIRQMHVRTENEGTGRWMAHVEIKVQNLSDRKQAAELFISIDKDKEKIVGCENEISIEAGQEITIVRDLSCHGVSEWTQSSPELYMINAELYVNGKAEDDLTDRFGFREIVVEGSKILLNGKPVRIKGVCRHEDHPQYGCALPCEAMAYDLALIKDLGANSVRTTHYPNDERFLDMCDEMGILVWEENHARGLNEEAMRNPFFEPQAEQVITEMIESHYNHPCIYIWGILNECASETEYGRKCYAAQFELIRKMDTTRPCSFASCRIKNDICLDLPDVVSFNIYPQWYLDIPVKEYLDDLYEWIQDDTPGTGKPFLITETGAGGLYGYRNPEHSKWTEEYQAYALEKQLTSILANSGCMGVYIWQFCDNRVSEECFAGRPRTMNNKGIVDEFRRHKLSYDVVKRIYQSDI